MSPQKSPQNRILRLATVLYWVSTALAYALPCVIIYAIARGWFGPEMLRAQFPIVPADIPISTMQGVSVATIGVLSTFPLIAAFLAMRSLFARYRKGEILTDACAVDIIRIGAASVTVAAAAVIVPTLQILVLSWHATEGRILSVGIDGGTIGFLLTGGLLFTIGWVMREAARAAAENAEFV